VSSTHDADVKSVVPTRRSVSAICIQPIGVDLVAATAFDTLARKMGLAGVLETLGRETVWLLSFDCEPGRAAGLAAALAENTGIFVNPNTHRHVVVPPTEPIPHGPAQGREPIGAALWSYNDPQVSPVESAVRARMGVTELTAIRRMTMWWPGWVHGGGVSRPAADVVTSLVATRSRKEGLLANPHSEGWYVVESPHTPGMILEAVEEMERGIRPLRT
jgi:hypothetical protein